MLMTSARRPAKGTLRGWAIDVLQEAGTIRECEEHGWMRERADPHARKRAFDIARREPPAGVSPDAAAAEVRDVLNSIGDTCPEDDPSFSEAIPTLFQWEAGWNHGNLTTVQGCMQFCKSVRKCALSRDGHQSSSSHETSHDDRL